MKISSVKIGEKRGYSNNYNEISCATNAKYA